MPPSQSARKQYRELTVVRDVGIVSNPGKLHSERVQFMLRLSFARIVRAFLVEEAKVVKKVIKQQAASARK